MFTQQLSSVPPSLQTAEESAEYQKRLVGLINALCHELRNPLHGVFASLDTLNQSVSTIQTLMTPAALANSALTDALKELSSSIKVIEECSAQQKNIVDMVLDLQKIKANKIALNEDIFNPRETFVSIATMFSKELKRKSLSLKIESESADMLIKMDVSRLRQILINLISNAIKFTEHGSVSVNAKITSKNLPAKILTEIKQEPDSQLCQFECEVRDTGIGMTSEEQKDLFTEFKQANKQISQTYGGSGLGLSICKSLIELMGGNIDVTSTKGEGSCFHFKINCLKLTPKEILEVQTKNINANFSQPIISPDPNIQILIVDDNIVNQKILKKYLTKLGYNSSIASNGNEAIKLHKEKHFNLIFMDVVMSGMSGIEATKRIRAEEKAQSTMTIPIIGTSANREETQIKEAKDAGMTGYLIKPFAIPDVNREINDHINSELRTVFASLKINKEEENPLLLQLKEITSANENANVNAGLEYKPTTEITLKNSESNSSKQQSKTTFGKSSRSIHTQLFTPVNKGASNSVNNTSSSSCWSCFGRNKNKIFP